MTAPTRGNDYLDVKYKIVALLIACTGFGTLFAPPAVRAQQRDEKQALVKVSAEVISVRQCINSIDDQRQTTLTELLLRLIITNVNSRPLIIYRYDPAAFDARLSRSLADMPNSTFHFKERPALALTPPARNFHEPDPTNDFRILQPNESFTYAAPESVIFLSTESPSSKKHVFEGEMFLQLKAQTWYWEVEKAEQLRQRWARYGEFFYQDVTVEPFRFTINKSGADTPRCNTQ
ncbi:MAG TPA: hypothetical protein VFY61_05905 [Pyrinomonadaceae bacterium]|nr:hypothetical protein [Pyrinomonadaceae bacterium]